MSHVFHVVGSRPVLTRSSVPMLSKARPSVDSEALLKGGREVIIRHGDQEYRLRHTQNDKLILTK